MDVEAKLHSLHNCDADKTSDKLKDTNSSHLPCAVLRPCEISPSAPSFPAAAELPWLLRHQHKLLLQFSAQRSSSPTFLQVPPSKQTEHITTHSTQNFLQVSTPQHDGIPMTSSSSLAQESAKHICAVPQFPLIFPCRFCSLSHFSLTFLFWHTSGGKTNWNMLHSWNYSSLHGFEIKQKINFPKNPQWMLK